jgi:hypothetical protein
MSKEDQMRGVKPYQFKPGESGNPLGRPKGSKNRMKLLAEQLIGNNAKLIVKKVISMALNGNEACLKMCMDRILPAQRAVDGEQRDKQQAINIIIEAAQQVTVSKETYTPTQPLIDVVETEGETK